MRLLLISSSNVHGYGYLDHPEPAMRAFLGDARRVAFVPFAAHDHDAYTTKVRERLARMDLDVIGIDDLDRVEPPSFAALGLIDFQINPHYVDPDPQSTHRGETREERIREYLEENAGPVVGLREGSILQVENNVTTLLGEKTARLFPRGEEPVEIEPGVIAVPSASSAD